MARRLVARHHVEAWEERLAAAVADAWRAQRADVDARLRAAGLQPESLTAASAKKVGLAVLAAAGAIWAADAWARNVATHVEPAARAVSQEAAQVVAGALPPSHSWGAGLSTGAIVGAVVGAITAAGNYIGKRLEAAAAKPGPSSAVSDVLSTAETILSGNAAALGSMVAGASAQDVLAAAAAQGLFTIEPTVTWNAVNDDATREWHAEADGQTVGLNEAFDVMGEPLMYPGDPAGSDENTINCRCWLTYEGVNAAGEEAA